MSQTSRGANKGSKRANPNVTASFKPTLSRSGAAQTGIINNGFIADTSRSRSSQQQQQQMFLSNNGPFGNVSNNSSSSNNNNRLATLATVSVAAAAAAASTTRKNHHLPITNAPTSLTNLARLGGITLLPVSGNANEGTLSNVAIELDNFNRNNINGTQTSINNSFLPNISTNTSNNSHVNTTAFIANNQWQVRSTPTVLARHDLDSVPSVRLLNKASSMDSANLWIQTGTVGDNNLFGNPRVQRSDTTMFPASTTTLTTGNTSSPKKNRQNMNPKPSQARNSVNQSFTAHNNTDMSTFFNPPPRSYQQQTIGANNILQNNYPSRPFDQTQSNELDDLETTNNSLMKLMAILNNPALTITAVNNSPPNVSSYVSGNDNNGISNCAYRYLDRVNDLSASSAKISNPVQSKYPEPDTAKTNRVKTQSTAGTSRSKVPQSAANLQLLFKSDDTQLALNKQSNQQRPKVQASPSNKNPASSNSTSNLGWSSNKIVTDQNNGSSTNHSNSISNHGDSAVHPNAFLSIVGNDNMTYQNRASTISHSRPEHTVSVQLLKHIANQAQDDESDWMVQHDPDAVGREVLEPECIITNVRSLLPFVNEAKYKKTVKDVKVDGAQKRHLKTVLTASKKRLCVINQIESAASNATNITQDPLADVQVSIVDATPEEEVFVSERHEMLSAMLADFGQGNSGDKSRVPEPDDIFINRSKKVMSKIDTMLERKKRKRFERISGRSAPKTNSLEEQCEESEAEWSDDEIEVQEKLSFVPIQLPLDDEELSSTKNNFIHSLGLVSRYERQKLCLLNTEKQMSQVTPRAYEEIDEVSEDLKRMVETVAKTGGTDIQLRIESNIKRNDLPLIEGLSRNTSRVKMSYMNILGLEKRSKRTTLYKLKNADGSTSSVCLPKQQNDLNLNLQMLGSNVDRQAPLYGLYINKPTQSVSSSANNVRSDPRDEQSRIQAEVKRSQSKQPQQAYYQPQQHQQQRQKQLYLNCRDTVKPNKNDYMKSLGLMAS